MYLKQLEQIEHFVFDVDGVFTDGTLLVTESGEQLRSMNIRDGYAVKKAVQSGLHIVIITGGRSEGVRKRFEGLEVKDIFLGVQDKVSVLQDLAKKGQIDLQTTAYMGDDMPDLDVIQKAAFKACPADAIPEIQQVSDYVSPINGGEGCVRDLLEKALKLRGLW